MSRPINPQPHFSNQFQIEGDKYSREQRAACENGLSVLARTQRYNKVSPLVKKPPPITCWKTMRRFCWSLQAEDLAADGAWPPRLSVFRDLVTLYIGHSRYFSPLFWRKRSMYVRTGTEPLSCRSLTWLSQEPRSFSIHKIYSAMFERKCFRKNEMERLTETPASGWMDGFPGTVRYDSFVGCRAPEVPRPSNES